MAPSPCPNDRQLSAFVVGELSDEVMKIVTEHTSSCAACQKRLQALDKMTDGLIHQIRQPRAREKPEEARALEKLIRQAGAIGTPATRPARKAVAARQPEGPYDFLSPPQEADEIGRIGNYRVLKQLGAGGMGVVFQAEDLHLKRLVALKVMAPRMATNENARQRFLREARAIAALSHRHVVTVFQAGEENGVLFLAMELLQGETLEQRLAGEEGQARVSPLPEVLRIGQEIADGLAAAHQHGLIHRDIKPSNIWLEKEGGQVKIIDFGLVRPVNEDLHLTSTGVVMGTAAYMAPEQAAGQLVDFRSDLFSFGCVLYELCTGAAPFQGSNAFDTMMAVMRESPQPVSELNPGIPPGLAELVHKLLAKAPADRPSSARMVGNALQAIQLQHWYLSRRLLLSAGVLSAAVLLLSFALIPWKNREPSKLYLEVPDTDVAVPLDGSPVGRQSLRDGLPLNAGKHRLLASKTGFLDFVDEFEVGPGEKVERTVQLIPLLSAKVDEAWLAKVAGLRAIAQALAVGEMLAKLNPGFNGFFARGENYYVNRQDQTGSNHYVIRLIFCTDTVTNISPIRALKKLQVLDCRGSAPGKGKLADLSSLKGMNLRSLDCRNNPVQDFAPLKDVPLETLWCDQPERHQGMFSSIKSLKKINGKLTR